MKRRAMAALTGLSVALLSITTATPAQQAPPAAPASAPPIVLRAAHLFDGRSGRLVSPGTLVVQGGRIAAVGDAAVPAGAKVIDLGDATLLPGFIDAHVHINGRSLGQPGAADAEVRDYAGFGAIVGAENARRTLMNGFTTIRVVGSPDFTDVALRKAIDEGWTVGPRMQVAAHSIGITGGHCDENGYRPGLMDGDPRTGIADGVEQIRAAVRYQVKYGADVIKTCATGGVLSEGDAVGATQYTQEEMNALVAEAHRLERRVAAHAHGTEGIKVAVRAGVNSIEHGSFLDEEGARMMAQRGTYLVPTLSAGETVLRAADHGVLTGLRAEKARAAGAAMRNAIRIAVAAGVPIALGTDAGVGAHGTNGHEFTLMNEWGGMSPMQVIVAGTSNAAKLLGWQDRVGTLAAGRLADVVAVRGDPLTNVRTLESGVVFVMKNGVIDRQP